MNQVIWILGRNHCGCRSNQNLIIWLNILVSKEYSSSETRSRTQMQEMVARATSADREEMHLHHLQISEKVQQTEAFLLGKDSFLLWQKTNYSFQWYEVHMGAHALDIKWDHQPLLSVARNHQGSRKHLMSFRQRRTHEKYPAFTFVCICLLLSGQCTCCWVRRI